jgi:pimeloyl-ACP methyl ester carboxylesterase
MGHAVITVDLRGHGRSTTWKGPRGRQEIDRAKMGRREITYMALDIETVKKFLLAEHNQGKLNIELLCVVSADVSAIVALNWAIMDWNVPPLPTLKQGQDVKALVLLSPKQSFRGLSAANVFRDNSPGGAQLKSNLSVMIVVGAEDPEAFDEAERLYSSFKRFRAGQPDDLKERSLFFIRPATSLQGTKLVSTRGLSVQRDIATFMRLRLVDKQVDLPWKDRSNPLGD